VRRRQAPTTIASSSLPSHHRTLALSHLDRGRRTLTRTVGDQPQVLGWTSPLFSGTAPAISSGSQPIDQPSNQFRQVSVDEGSASLAACVLPEARAPPTSFASCPAQPVANLQCTERVSLLGSVSYRWKPTFSLPKLTLLLSSPHPIPADQPSAPANPSPALSFSDLREAYPGSHVHLQLTLIVPCLN
jgi:hypothetical protein